MRNCPHAASAWSSLLLMSRFHEAWTNADPTVQERGGQHEPGTLTGSTHRLAVGVGGYPPVATAGTVGSEAEERPMISFMISVVPP